MTTPTPPAPQMKPWIEAIHAYVPGRATGAGGRPLVKLSANENPLGCSPAVLAALATPPRPADYPDPDATALRGAIAAVHDLDPARIVCGAGSGELLACAVQAFAGPGDEVVMPRFSFSLYPIVVAKVGSTAVHAETPGYAADVDALIAAVTERTRVVLLDNPNNPLGGALPAGEVARLHAALPPHVLLVVDEAYAEYVGVGDPLGGLALAGAAENVLCTRTLSKAYGIAGERVGWATGAPALVGALNRLRGAFNVSATGQRAGIAALGDQGFVAASREANARGRGRLEAAVAALGNHGLRAVPSAANFVLVLFEGELTAAAALEGLAEAGYAVRHLPGQGLPHALRITIGTEADMDGIVAALARLTGSAIPDRAD